MQVLRTILITLYPEDKEVVRHWWMEQLNACVANNIKACSFGTNSCMTGDRGCGWLSHDHPVSERLKSSSLTAATWGWPGLTRALSVLIRPPAWHKPLASIPTSQSEIKTCVNAKGDYGGEIELSWSLKDKGPCMPLHVKDIKLWR